MEKNNLTKSGRLALYHRVYRRENFEKAAKDLFGLIQKAQKDNPNMERVMYVDIDGHRNEAGGFDADMRELQIEFGTSMLLPYVKELHFPLGTIINKGEQNNDIPEKLFIGNACDEKNDKLEDLYIENYSNTEFMSEDDVYQYMKEVSDFLRDYDEYSCWNYDNYEYDDLGYLKMWKKHMSELIIELFNSFVHGNYLSVAAMTRTLMECYVLVAIFKKEQSSRLLDEWWICNVIRKMKSGKDAELPEETLEYLKTYCKERDINFKDKWNYYAEAKKENAWLRELMGKKGIGFEALCKEINEDEIYTDYGNASSYIHGQDITTKVFPFTFYSSIYIKLYLMMQYIFKAIRLFTIDEEMDEKMVELEEKLYELGDKYLE